MRAHQKCPWGASRVIDYSLCYVSCSDRVQMGCCCTVTQPLPFNKVFFWDVPVDSLEIEKHAGLIIERVSSRENLTVANYAFVE